MTAGGIVLRERCHRRAYLTQIEWFLVPVAAEPRRMNWRARLTQRRRRCISVDQRRLISPSPQSSPPPPYGASATRLSSTLLP
ncbi:hypothetical protein GWI33_005433 [Rhynchophorus ferrugineus]|uniref:Uncharacterized protein n=1 Tax=Rhynchophorus ferrugineus TaxID=354439 RepID=A0A834IN91_RHYFE|nr:hypothetical protein GWI33_005433 [Rhynchophorus ferrugineus]